MKQMLTAAGGTFFALGLILIIFGGGSYWNQTKFKNDLANRSQLEKTASEWTGLEGGKEEQLKLMESGTIGSLIGGGVACCIGVALALAGRNKSEQ